MALIFIGPKELPAVLRTLGQWTRRIRSMAADFQGQFQEAMREAEMADLKKQVDDIAHDVKSYDPLKDVRSNVEAAGNDIQASLEASSGAAADAKRRGQASRAAGSGNPRTVTRRTDAPSAAANIRAAAEPAARDRRAEIAPQPPPRCPGAEAEIAPKRTTGHRE